MKKTKKKKVIMEEKRRLSDKIFGSNLFKGVLMMILTSMVGFIAWEFKEHIKETELSTITNIKQDGVNVRQDETLNILVKLIEKNGIKADNNSSNINDIKITVNQLDYEVKAIKKEVFR